MKISRGLHLILYILLVIAELFPLGIQNISLYLFVLWILLSWIAFPTVFHSILTHRRYVCLFLFFVFCFLSTLIGKDFFQGFAYTMYIMRVVSPILMYDLLRTCSKKQQRFFVLTLMAVFVLYAVWMYRLIDIYGAELGLKNSVLGNDSEERVSSVFGYIYSLPILMATLLLCLRSLYKQMKSGTMSLGWIRIAAIAFVISYLTVLVFKSLFIIATIITIVGLCFALFYTRGKRWWITSFSTLVLLSSVYVSQYEYIARSVSNVGSQTTDQRVEEIFQTLTGRGRQAEDMSSRQDLTMVSINTFFQYPIIGANHLIGSNRYNNTVIGNHSEWFDLLALYGVFALLLYYVLYKSFKVQYKDTGNYLPAVLYVITGFLNPMFNMTVNLTVFVLAPLLSPILGNNNTLTKHENTNQLFKP